MKKLIIAAYLILASVVLYATEITRIAKNDKGKEVTNRYDVVKYVNSIAAKKNAKDEWSILDARTSQDLAEGLTPKEMSAIDDILSKHGFLFMTNSRYVNYEFLWRRFPKTAAGQLKYFCSVPRDDAEIDIQKEYVNAVVSNRVTNVIRAKVALQHLYDELKTYGYLEQSINAYLYSHAARMTMRALRRDGQSFVSITKKDKDGKSITINPIQDRVNVLVAAFNAPKFAGIKDALHGCGLDFGLDFTKLMMSNEGLDALKTDILNGDKEFSRANSQILRLNLGVDGYNEFVKLYNGSK